MNCNADFFSRWARYKEYEDVQKLQVYALNSLVLRDLRCWRLNRCRPRREGRIRPWRKRILHCFALNTELKRLLNDEPTIAEKNEEKEAKEVDDARFMTTFIPDSSEASRVRATLIQEQKKDPFLGKIIEKLLTAEAVEKHLAEEQITLRELQCGTRSLR